MSEDTLSLVSIDLARDTRRNGDVDEVGDAPSGDAPPTRDELPSVTEILRTTSEDLLPRDVPFPQADDLEKVIAVVGIVNAGCDASADISRRCGFVRRQADFYGNAAVFLGFLVRRRGGFALSAEGARLLASTANQQRIIILQRMASLPVFREALVRAQIGVPADRPEVSEWIQSATGLTGKTIGRRVETVLSWTAWIAGAT